jgi:hypothetical protein
MSQAQGFKVSKIHTQLLGKVLLNQFDAMINNNVEWSKHTAPGIQKLTLLVSETLSHSSHRREKVRELWSHAARKGNRTKEQMNSDERSTKFSEIWKIFIYLTTLQKSQIT